MKLQYRYRNIVFLIVSIILPAVMTFIKVYSRSAKEYHAAEEAYKNGNYLSAIVHYERSIHWYIPVNQYIADSANSLWKIGKIMEKRGDIKMALIAYRSLRSSFYSARSLYTPYREWINRCNDKISTLTAKSEALTQDNAPHPWRSIFLEIGFIGWICCTVGLIMNVFNTDESINRRSALCWGTSFGIFYTVWIIAMIKT